MTKIIYTELLVLTALFMSLALMSGCATITDETADLDDRPRREVKVDDEPEAGLAEEEAGVEGAADEELRLESEYERAMRLYEQGDLRAAKVLMVSTKSQAQESDADLPKGFEEDFQRIIDAESDAEEAEPEPEPDTRALKEKMEDEYDPEGYEPIEASAPGDASEYDELDLDVEYGQPEFNLPGLLDSEVADEGINLDFHEVDIRVLLETISDISGANFLVDPDVSGEVTLISSSEVKISKVFRVLESILEIHGWSAVPSDDVIKVVPKEEGVRRQIPTRIGSDPENIPRDDSFATQVMRLRHIDVEDAAPLIEPRMSTQGDLSAHEDTNTIFVTDISSSIYQVALLVNQIDMPLKRAELVIFPLRYASSSSVAEKINNLIDAEEISMPGRPSEMEILPDERTNAIVVYAGSHVIESVESLVEHLDVPRPEESVNVHVVELYNADAEEVVDSLSATIDALTDHEDADPIHIVADTPTNALIIAASPQDFQVLSTVVDDLDIVREQVLVELRIMEATQRTLKEIGFDWSTMDMPTEDSVRGVGGTDLGPRRDVGVGAEGIRLSDPGGMAAALVKGERIGAMLRALEGRTEVDVLSTPHILTANHQEANISVVENVPFVRETRIVAEEDRDEIRTWDYRDVGIQLDITPHVGAGGMVRMLIGSEFSKVVEEGEGRLRTSKREAETTVGVQCGETVVIGGLIQDDTISTVEKVPFLGSIPVLGHLFTSRSEDVEKTNLLIFITPHVLTDREELAEMSHRKEEGMD